jgi:hypothetical protein
VLRYSKHSAAKCLFRLRFLQQDGAAIAQKAQVCDAGPKDCSGGQEYAAANQSPANKK